jgi:uncharacterized protein YjlB
MVFRVHSRQTKAFQPILYNNRLTSFYRHYHSSAHECMVVLTGTARIRFGVADVPEGDSPTGKEEGGIEVDANPGDVFILPAGTAHKTFNTIPESSLKLLTPGDGHAVDLEGLKAVKPDGFTMMGAYPEGSDWDHAVGGESEGAFEEVWSVPKPSRDPVLGDQAGGLCELW